MNLKIAVDVSAARGQQAGIGNYARFLARALARHDPGNRYLFWSTGPVDLELPPEAAAHCETRNVRVPYKILGRFWHHFGRPPLEWLTGPADVAHATGFLSPVPRRARLVCTIHDVSAFVYPEAADQPPPPLSRFRRWVEPAVRILCPSEHARREIHRVVGLPLDRIRAVPHMYDPLWLEPVPPDAVQAALAKQGLSRGRYYLAVGTIQPRKNLERLVRAYVGGSGVPDGVPLVLVGPAGWGNASILRLLAEPDVARRVRRLPYVPFPQLRALYAGAKGLLFPSLYEGFGLPILEGMASGIPVLTSGVSSMPEVAGDAALLVDPLSVDAIAEEIRRLDSDESLRAELVRKGAVQARRFTWEETARRTAEVYREAAGA